jgi:hypothetical protein
MGFPFLFKSRHEFHELTRIQKTQSVIRENLCNSCLVIVLWLKFWSEAGNRHSATGEPVALLASRLQAALTRQFRCFGPMRDLNPLFIAMVG